MSTLYSRISFNKKFKDKRAGTYTLANNLVVNVLEAGNTIIINTPHPLTNQQTFDSKSSANNYLVTLSRLGSYTPSTK